MILFVLARCSILIKKHFLRDTADRFLAQKLVLWRVFYLWTDFFHLEIVPKLGVNLKFGLTGSFTRSNAW